MTFGNDDKEHDRDHCYEDRKVVSNSDHIRISREIATLAEQRKELDRRISMTEDCIKVIEKNVDSVRQLIWRILFITFVLGLGNIAAKFGLENILVLLKAL